MAWIDDRIWCHPKFTDLSSPAFRAYIQGVAYASGMSTRGRLTVPQQQMIGASAKVRRELVAAGLWDTENASSIIIHDWDEHNGRRDERRAADRERKRLARAKDREMSAGTSAGQSTGRSTGPSNGASAGTAHVDGSEGSEGKPLPTQPVKEDAVEPTADDIDFVAKVRTGAITIGREMPA